MSDSFITPTITDTNGSPTAALVAMSFCETAVRSSRPSGVLEGG